MSSLQLPSVYKLIELESCGSTNDEARKLASSGEQKYPDGMELVWDLESDDFRVFNWRTCEGMPKMFDIEEDLFIE